MSRRCSRCQVEQPLSNFGAKKHRKDGLSLWCKSCNCANARRWSKENPEKKAQAAKAWKRNNPEAFKVIVKRSAEKHRQSRLPKQRDQARRRAETLTDGYVATTLGISKELIPAELIELKRVNLQLQRLIRERECVVDGEAGKRCSVCHCEKILSAFPVRTSSKDGRNSRCRECDKIKQKIAYEKYWAKIRRNKKPCAKPVQ